MINIYQKFIKLISFLIFLTVIIGANSSANSIMLENSSNEKIKIRLVSTDKLRSKGLSGVKPKEFQDNEGMLFVFKTSDTQRFWMPDTYFNLDIIFLNRDLKIVGIEKNVPHHIGYKEPPVIYRTAHYISQFVLETKAGVAFSKNLKVGDKLQWKSPTSLSEIIRDTHP